MTATSRRIDISASPEAVYEYAYEQGWTDGLPILPPTPELVERMLEHVGAQGAEVVAEIPPAMCVATVEKIAINAVMAGCRPEYMPVLIAAVEAMAEPQFRLAGIQPTTNPVGPALVINGPIRNEIDLNCGSGVLGPGWRSNATIGRAIRLILLNIGGAIPGRVDKASHGMPGKYTFCFGENEEASPWEPLHVERNFSPDESTVTVIGVSGTVNVNAVNRDPKEIVLLIANTLGHWGGNTMIYGEGEVAVILAPGLATVLSDAGYLKKDVKRSLWQDSGTVASILPYRSRSRAPLSRPDGIARPAESPEGIIIIVAGGPEPHHAVVLPSFAGNSFSVTKPIRKRLWGSWRSPKNG